MSTLDAHAESIGAAPLKSVVQVADPCEAARMVGSTLRREILTPGTQGKVLSRGRHRIEIRVRHGSELRDYRIDRDQWGNLDLEPAR